MPLTVFLSVSMSPDSYVHSYRCYTNITILFHNVCAATRCSVERTRRKKCVWKRHRCVIDDVEDTLPFFWRSQIRRRCVVAAWNVHDFIPRRSRHGCRFAPNETNTKSMLILVLRGELRSCRPLKPRSEKNGRRGDDRHCSTNGRWNWYSRLWRTP